MRSKAGLGSFLIGLVMSMAGAYLLTNQIHVSSNYWGFHYALFGGFTVSAFGVTLIPLLLGIVLVFFNTRSKAGWILAGGSLLMIFVGLISNLNVYFAPTTLYITLIMLTLLMGGVGLMLRGLFDRIEE